jgi:hypothetical protein
MFDVTVHVLFNERQLDGVPRANIRCTRQLQVPAGYAILPTSPSPRIHVNIRDLLTQQSAEPTAAAKKKR